MDISPALYIRSYFQNLSGISSLDNLGLPMLFPLALALAIPDLTLWDIISFSISANTAHICSMPFVIGSKDSLLQSVPKFLNYDTIFIYAKSKIRHRC